MTVVGDWVLGGDLTAPAAARHALAGWAREQALHEPVVDDLLLVANELVTNAVQHAGGPLALRVDLSADAVIVGVTDAHGGSAAVRPGRGNAHGRGLLIVRGISDSWGVTRHRGGGKTVWARLATP